MKDAEVVELSVVIPCFNEEENVRPTHQRLVAALSGGGVGSFELVFVENGSTDGTGPLLDEIVREDPRVRKLKLTRNFGNQGGVHAGYEHARGRYIAGVDCDLQDPPELLPVMLAKAMSGYPIVYGRRVARQETLFRRVVFWGFYRLLRRASDVDIPLDAGDFCVMRRDVVDTLLSMREHRRFIRGLRAWTGFRSVGIPYERAARARGRTKFDVWTQLDLATDALIGFSFAPLRAMLWLGLVTMVGFGALGALELASQLHAGASPTPLAGVLPPGLDPWRALLFVLLGAILFSLGVIGEYLARVLDGVRARPHYVLEREGPDEPGLR